MDKNKGGFEHYQTMQEVFINVVSHIIIDYIDKKRTLENSNVQKEKLIWRRKEILS